MIELLARPYQGRLIAGVCAAIENAYGIPLWLIRTMAVVAFFAAPISLLLYLLLAISIPSERGFAGSLFFREPSPGTLGFATAATLLLNRNAARLGKSSNRQKTMVPLLFLFTFLFGLPKIEANSFDQLHPLLDSMFVAVGRVASVVLYVLIGLSFLIRIPLSRRPIAFTISARETFALEGTDLKSIGGVAIAISRMTHLDVSVIRVILLLLNFLTIGAIGAIYFLVMWLMRHRVYVSTEHGTRISASEEQPSLFNPAMAAIFILLAIVRISTEFRWFFFNEQFVRGLLLCTAGVLLSRRMLPLAILTGAVLLFFGVHDISVASFHVQPTAANRWVIDYAILALGIGYYCIVSLRGKAKLIGFAFAAVPVIAAALVMTQLVSEPFLFALGRFYDFFSPLIFSALALWVAMES